MVIKMVALGIFGQKCYLGDTWNRLDFFIVMAGSVTQPHKLAFAVKARTPQRTKSGGCPGWFV